MEVEIVDTDQETPQKQKRVKCNSAGQEPPKATVYIFILFYYLKMT